MENVPIVYDIFCSGQKPYKGMSLPSVKTTFVAKAMRVFMQYEVYGFVS